ncbi:polyprenyl synthetase family protein [Pseudoduganella namucuonensis]|uniref:Geranylgeranyl diphosphate synthase, type II n=1 Tax=Pseudoduganella namucuonensis TaxID=1035707 RepID=A0A1I7M294_9BURK|nr:polyprenyl synthetase family protein [Pseudoduganella namucuonensis]SFV16025.1 geranylgeranyl diphosphate synthase, type II [Pseudoduganella namucuonensis]
MNGRQHVAGAAAARDPAGEMCTLLNDGMERALASSLPKSLIPLAGYATSGGKRIRGRLCLEIGRAAGVPQMQVLPLAVSIELVHAASLLLDDLPSMGNALLRRNKPCFHVVHGVAAAELLAVAILAAAFRALCATPVSAAKRIEAIAGQSTIVGIMCSGQLPSNAQDPLVNSRKTASLFGYAARVAVLPMDRHEDIAHAYETFGHAVGLAYQAHDDCVDAGDDREAGAASQALERHLASARDALKQLPARARVCLEGWFRQFAQQIASEAETVMSN